MTHWQYQAWQVWLRAQWDVPDRSDVYQMQTAAAVTRSNAKHPNRVKLKDFILKFGGQAEAAKPKMSVAQASAVSKAQWMSRMTMPVQVVEG